MHQVYQLRNKTQRRTIWKELVDQWYQSQLTANEFSEYKKIKSADLRRWSYRLKKQAPKQPNSGTESDTDSVKHPATSFVPLKLHSEITANQKDSYIDLLIEPYCLRIYHHSDLQVVARLLLLLSRKS